MGGLRRARRARRRGRRHLRAAARPPLGPGPGPLQGGACAGPAPPGGEDDPPPAPRPPPPAGPSRYGWLVGIAVILILGYITLNTIRSDHSGSAGVPAGHPLPAFAAPL